MRFLKLAISGLVLLTALAAGNAPRAQVKQTGSVTPGHAACWSTTGVIKDCGSATTGAITSLGVTASGPALCQQSASSGAFNRVCLQATSSGGGINMDNIGGATGAFTFTLNGVAQGLASVNLPVTADEFACFADSFGTLKDCNGSITGLTVTNHAVAVGTGVLGFTSVGPGNSGTVFVGQGSSADPAFTNAPALVNTQNAPSQATLANASTGTAAFAGWGALNSANGASFGIGGTGFTGLGSLATNRAFIDAASGTLGILFNNEGNNPIVIGRSSVEIARFPASGGVTLNVGLAGTSTGSIGFSGATSGTATITAQATAGTPTFTLPNASGTFAVSVSAPLALSATTGNLSITGAAGQVLAGATPAFTATPTLGASGTLGSVTFGNATSGLLTLQPVTGALGTVTVNLPAANTTLAGLAVANVFTATQSLVLSQDAATVSGVTNVNTGTSAAATFVTTNANGNAAFGIGGANYSVALQQNRAFVAADAALAGIVLYNGGDDPIIFALNTAERARFPVAGGVVLNLGVTGTLTGSLGFSGGTSGTVTVQAQAAAGTYNFNLPTSAGTSGQPLLSGGGGATAQTYGTLGPAAGGTGIANNASSTLTISGAFASTFTITGVTAVTFPTSGTLAILGANAFTASQTLTLSQNATTSYTISNVNTGTAATAAFVATNANGNAVFGTGGANYTGSTLQTNRAYIAADATLDGIVIDTIGDDPIIFARQDLERCRVPVSATTLPFQCGVNGGALGAIGFLGSTSGTAIITAQAAAGTPTLTIGTTSGTIAASATSPLSIAATTGVISCSTCGVTGTGLNQFASTTSAQLAGVISDETGTGVLVFGTAPTFTTSITDPLVIGGTAAGSSLSLQSTSNGTASGDFVDVLVGNNGAQRAARFLNGPFMLLGGTASTSGYRFQIDMTSGGLASSSIEWSNNTTPPFVSFYKSRGATIGSHTVVQNDDNLGFFAIGGSDGAAFVNAVTFGVAVDGTPGTNDMPGRFVVSTTPDGSATPSESFRLNNAGATYFPRVGTTASAANVFMDNASTPANQILRSTSSIRYKHDLQNLQNDEIAEVLKLRGVTYRSLAQADDPERRFFGFTAEDVAEVDGRLVNYTNGLPDGVQYERIIVPLVELVKQLNARIEKLEVAR